MDLRDLLSPLSQLGDDAWETVSSYSLSDANTGYTGGTRSSVNLSKHAKVRMLERGVDDYIIRHVLARGTKTKVQDCWRFEKDGLVVIASEAQPSSDQCVVTTYYTDCDGIRLTFGSGFINERAMGLANDKYEVLRDNLQTALDGEERLVVLKSTLGEECERFFHGVDLERTPPDRPLLFHCAEMGYTESVEFLLRVGTFNAGLQGPKECTLLHIVAYAGRADLMPVIGGEIIKNLADLSNAYGELPEITAWRRYCGDAEAVATEDQADDDIYASRHQFLDIAMACRNARLGTTDASEADFIAMSETELQRLDPTSDSIFDIVPGVRPELVVNYFENPVLSVRHSVILLKSISNLRPPLLQRILSPLQCSVYLANLTLSNCGLRPEHASVLASYLKQAAVVRLENLGLAGNPLGNEGASVLSQCAAFFNIEVIDLSDVGLDEDGIHKFASNALALGRPVPKYRLRKLILRRNDLSAKVQCDEINVNVEESAKTLQEHLVALPSVSEASNVVGESFVSAPLLENKPIAMLCCMLALTNITNLVLDKTRLTSWQVSTLCQKLPELLPWLATLELVGVSFPPAAQASIMNMLAFMDKESGKSGRTIRSSSMCDTNAFGLKRIGINRLEYAELWANIQKRIKDRLKQELTQNYTKIIGQQKERTRIMRNAGDGTHVIRCHTNRNKCRLGLEHVQGSEGFEVPLVFLYTPHGSLIARDPDRAAAELDGGVAVECVLKYDAQHRCLAVSTMNQLHVPSAPSTSPRPVKQPASPRIWDPNRKAKYELVTFPPCLQSCMCVFYRVHTQQVLMRTIQSDALRTLCRRLNYGVLPEKYDLEIRFPGSFPKNGSRFTIQQLLANLDLSSFGDDEVYCLANFNDPECFLTITGGRRSITDHALSKIARVNACPVVCEMRSEFASEQQRRAQSGRTVGAASSFFAFANKLESQIGDREREWYFPSPVDTALKQMLESHFVSSYTVAVVSTNVQGSEQLSSFQDGRIHEVSERCTIDTVDMSKAWKHRIVLIGITEDMIDTETNLPRGFLLKPASVRSPPFWVSVASIGDPFDVASKAQPGRIWAREVLTPLSKHLAKYQAEGFNSIEEDLMTLMQNFNQKRCLRIARTAQIVELVNSGARNWQKERNGSNTDRATWRQRERNMDRNGKTHPSTYIKSSRGQCCASTDEPLGWRRRGGSGPSLVAAKQGDQSGQTAACDLSDSKATGMGDIPPPCASFDACERIFNSSIMRVLRSQGFPTPTAIQALSWPVATSGRDLIGVAKTGSGKTLGFLLPAFQTVLRDLQEGGKARGPSILVMAPTRELVSQIHAEAEKFALPLRIGSCCCYGGAPRGSQLGQLRAGPHLVVGTPGRLNDFLSSDQLKLHACQHLVLDEADRMLDMGFKPQIDSIVDRIPRTRQTNMFTATWPLDVQQLATQFLRNPVHVQIGAQENSANRDIHQKICICDNKNNKFEKMLGILGEISVSDRVMIFVNTKRFCEDLVNDLYREGVEAVAIHGDLDQQDREDALAALKSGKAPVLVATDVAARGLDIKGVQWVISFDSAGKPEDHVHRIGRTGRAGMKGTAITLLLTNETRQAHEILIHMESAGQDIPSDLRDMAKQWTSRQISKQLDS